jgi:hypothetical protein
VSQSKPKVLVCVLGSSERHGWINPHLVSNLLTMSHDERYTVEIKPVIECSPVDFARNVCVTMARERKADTLLMFDNDQSSEINPLDVLTIANGKDIIGIPTMQSSTDSFQTAPSSFRICAGTIYAVTANLCRCTESAREQCS